MITFGAFTLDPDRRQLRKGGAPVSLEGRALDILIRLAANAGQVVGKRELIEAVWPGRVVQENNLAVHISALRRLLGAAPDGGSIIRTVPGRGYMLQPGGPGRGGPVLLPETQPARRGNSFVGRVQETAALSALLQAHRLVTITAGGGVGKTRLALRVADELAGRWRDGVHVAQLAHIDDPAEAAGLVARLFPLGAVDRPVPEQLAGFLRDRRLLLVLDNCEHVIGEIARLAAAVLDRCPGVSILATSREPLDVPDEHVFRLHPLSLPQDPAEAMHSDAVRLFLDRAAEAMPGFAANEASMPAIVAICRRLDGIALAIEMAVPRLRVLAPAQLATRLRESFDVLATPDRTVPERHRTLRAMLDWSHALLTMGEQALLRRLSLFAGAADFDAVLAVARPRSAARKEAELVVLEQLAGLVDKSLVATEAGPDGSRYRLPETVRDYGRARLAESGETGLRQRHAAHYTTVFESLAASWATTQAREWQPRAAVDAAELRAALAWSFGPEGDAGLGLRLVAATATAWWELPGLPLREGRQWFDLAVSRLGPDTPPEVAGRVWFGASWRDMRHDDDENLPAASRAVELARAAGDRVGLAAALWRAGSAVLTRRPPEEVARVLLEAEHLLRQMPPGRWLGLVLVRLGDLRARTGEHETGLAAYAEGLAIARSTGHVYGITNGGSNMADLLYIVGRPGDALAQLRDLRRTLPLGARTPLTATLTAHLVLAGATSEALDAVAEVLDMAPSIGYRGAMARSIETLALMRAGAGDAAGAARLAGFTRVLMAPLVRWAASRHVFDRLDAAITAALPAGERKALLEQGAAWDEATGVLMAEAAVRQQRALTPHGGAAEAEGS